ncbi:MAG TPA: hypothetical protein VMO54_08245 [Steroidobacteraceae bacterium]|nr:hypothetical protein [Steroidobacteraceae bacterium]
MPDWIGYRVYVDPPALATAQDRQARQVNPALPGAMTARSAVDMKVLIEQMREQVQNAE